MDKDKLPEKKLRNDEKNLLLRYFLQRIHNNEITQKEENVIELLKKSYDPAKNTRRLTDKELKKAIRRNRKQIMKKIGTSRYPERKNGIAIRHIPLFIGSSAAAIAFIIILLTTPFTKDPSFINTAQIPAEFSAIEKQFITGNDMKRIILADGSTVFLNQGTTISLRQGRFNAHTREIWLEEGEAFFNVEKEVNRPFIVHTPNGISTQVLGTSFNIRAYAELEEQVISVNTGRVQVYDKKENTIILDPNYKVSVKNRNNEFVAGKTDARNISAWRSGTIVLEEANIIEVAFRLKQAFNINLIYGNVVNHNEKIVTSFTLNTPQEEVLTTICKLYNVHYKRNNNTVELIK
ncbi:FecR family protein [uncultured Proteiniphilum sp.]|uniref:FecR family protein n=1 Tax=uncultured Proteiniphilum sp. TaxID=497637 RepID=UPI00260568F4|nr:FecR family protein [uncultured Proteiniphilum sp.]